MLCRNISEPSKVKNPNTIRCKGTWEKKTLCKIILKYPWKAITITIAQYDDGSSISSSTDRTFVIISHSLTYVNKTTAIRIHKHRHRYQHQHKRMERERFSSKKLSKRVLELIITWFRCSFLSRQFARFAFHSFVCMCVCVFLRTPLADYKYKSTDNHFKFVTFFI